MSGRNPIAEKLAAMNAAPTEQPQAQQVTPETGTPQSTPEDVQTPPAEAQQPQGDQHIESTTQTQTESQREEEATALETIEDGNASQTQGGENAEGSAASEPEQTSNWFEGDEDDTFSDTPANAVTELPEGDYSTIGNALGLENATGATVMEKINEIQSQNQELAAKVKNNEENSVYANPDLEAANELARNGGDYMGFLGLSNNNWDSVPDDVLVVEGKLRDAFPGNEEAMMSYLNEMDPVQKQMMATEIRQGLKQHDEQAKADIQRRSAERVRKIDMGIRGVLDKTDELYGLKLTAAMKRDIHSTLSTGDFVKDMFHDKNGEVSPEKMVKAAVALKNLKKIVQTARNVSSNAATEKILDEVSNPQVQRQGQMVDPKPKAPVDPITARKNALRSGGR